MSIIITHLKFPVKNKISDQMKKSGPKILNPRNYHEILRQLGTVITIFMNPCLKEY